MVKSKAFYQVGIICLLVVTLVSCQANEEVFIQLSQAVQEGELSTVQGLLESVDVADLSDSQLLHTAVVNGHLDIAKLLIAEGFTIEQPDEAGKTPLELALEEEQWDIALMLLDKGALTDGLDPQLSQTRVHQVLSQLGDGGSDLSEQAETIEAAYQLNPKNRQAQALFGLLQWEREQRDIAIELLLETRKGQQSWDNSFLRSKLEPLYQELGSDLFIQARDSMYQDLTRAKQMFKQATIFGNEFAYRYLMKIVLAQADEQEVKESYALKSYWPADASQSYMQGLFDEEKFNEYLAFVEETKEMSVSEVTPPGLLPSQRVTGAYLLNESTSVLTYQEVVGKMRQHDDPVGIWLYKLGQQEISTIYQSEAEKQYRHFTDVKQLEDGSLAVLEPQQVTLLSGEGFAQQEHIAPADCEGDLNISNDGTMLAYQSSDGLRVKQLGQDNSNLLLPAEGSNTSIKMPSAPQWSPDNTSIAYVMGGWEWTWGLGVIKADGTDNTFFDESDITMPRWLADNQRLTCHAYDYGDLARERNTALIIDINSGEISQLTQDANATQARPAPKGNKVAYLKQTGLGEALYILDLDNGEEKAVSNHVGVSHFSWSPEGDKLIYGVNIDESDNILYNIYVVDVK